MSIDRDTAVDAIETYNRINWENIRTDALAVEYERLASDPDAKQGDVALYRSVLERRGAEFDGNVVKMTARTDDCTELRGYFPNGAR